MIGLCYRLIKARLIIARVDFKEDFAGGNDATKFQLGVNVDDASGYFRGDFDDVAGLEFAQGFEGNGNIL